MTDAHRRQGSQVSRRKIARSIIVQVGSVERFKLRIG